jgi:hypothetical protein
LYLNQIQIKTFALEEHPFVTISGVKIIRKGFLDVPDREIGEVRESAESSMQYFENRFSIIEQKVESLEKNIEESENKGSFLMKLIHLKEYIAKFDGIGDFERLYRRLEEKENISGKSSIKTGSGIMRSKKFPEELEAERSL